MRVEVVRRRGVIVSQLGATEAVVGLGARPGETVQPAGRAVRLGLR